MCISDTRSIVINAASSGITFPSDFFNQIVSVFSVTVMGCEQGPTPKKLLAVTIQQVKWLCTVDSQQVKWLCAVDYWTINLFKDIVEWLDSEQMV